MSFARFLMKKIMDRRKFLQLAAGNSHLATLTGRSNAHDAARVTVALKNITHGNFSTWPDRINEHSVSRPI